MSDQKLSDLTAETTIAPDDLVMAVDVSDTTMAATGTNKKVTRESLQTYNAGTLTTGGKFVQDLSVTWNRPQISVTGASGTGTTATLTFADQTTAPYAIGATIVVASVNPSGYNGTHVVTGCTATSVSYANTTSTAYVSGGTINVRFTGVKFNATDTASASTSRLFDFQIGGVTAIAIQKNLNVILGNNDPKLLFGPYGTIQSNGTYSGTLEICGGSTVRAYAASSLTTFGVMGGINFGSGGPGTEDLFLVRDASNTLAQRRTTNAQTFRLYGTFTDGSNSRRLALSSTTGGAFTLAAEGLGTGLTGNTLAFATDGTTRLTIGSDGTSTFAKPIALLGSTSGTVTLQPAAEAGTYTLTLPTNDGDASQVLTTNGSGVLSWENPATLTPTTGSFSWNSSASPQSADFSPKQITTIHKNMKRCVINDSGVVQYYLDPFDSTLKADGTAATLTGGDGQVMVEIPKFWVKREKVGTRTTWFVSATSLSGYTVHPAFVKDGVEVNYRYYSAYDACVYDVSATAYIGGLNWDNNSGAGNGQAVDVTASTGDVLASVSGQFPMVGLQRAEFRTLAANRGSGWRQLDWTLFSAVQLLYLIEFQSFFSQNITGNGNTGTTYASSSGTQSDSGNSSSGKSNVIGNQSTDTVTGALSATRGVAYMSYRGIENLYGNIYNFSDGVIINPDGSVSAGQGDWWFTNNSADFSDSVKTNMTQITSGAATADGFSSAIAGVDHFFIATSTSGGSSTTFVTDQLYATTTADRILSVGGAAEIGAHAGLFFLNAVDAGSARLRKIGARLCF
jgi:hypothetical protein